MVDSARGLPVKESIRLKGTRKVMAQAMKTSVDSAALSQVTREIDVTDLKAEQNRQADATARISLNTLIMAAVAQTLTHHPLLNAELVDRDILVYDVVNLGMAVATKAGLIVAVVRDAQALSISDLATNIGGLVERARNGSLSIDDVEGGTFTVSNLGMYGVDGGFPIPRPPQGAILLVGRARSVPAVVDGQIAIRELAWFSLTYDHQFIDGVTAANFLQDLNALFSDPKSMTAAD